MQIQAYGMATLASGQVLTLSGDATELMSLWTPDNRVVSILDPDPLCGLTPEEHDVLLIAFGGRRSFGHLDLLALNQDLQMFKSRL